MAIELGVSGLASGFDWRSLVDQLVDVERAPERRLRLEQSRLGQRNSAYTSIVGAMASLKTRVDALKDPALFSSRGTKVGDATVASASVSGSAALGSYSFNVTQLATASARSGTGNVGRPLSATNDVSALLLKDAAVPTAISSGTFTINGKQVTISVGDAETAGDTLQQVFDKISAATAGAVTGGYDAGTDKVTFSGGGEIVLGSANDTSNFLQVARLSNNGTGTTSSSFALGVVKQSATLATANFATAVSDGGAGLGEFKINGVSIQFKASTDTVADVLARINNANTGVTASFDALNDRFVLTNKTTGDVGLALEDVTGNFLAAAGLSGGTLNHGKDLLYTINGGDQLTSRSNTITEASSSIAGLSVSALRVGLTSVEVTSDSARIKTAIADFLADYNKVQSFIDAQTSSTTDASGKVTAGVLAAESDANEVAVRLRGFVNATVAGLTGAVKRLDGLGISSNGNDNNLALTDSVKLDAFLASNLNDVQKLFSDSTEGIGVKLSSFLERTVGDTGSLTTRQTTLGKQITDIDTQVSTMERIILANRQRLIDSFVAMETAQSNINQQLQYLTKRFG